MNFVNISYHSTNYYALDVNGGKLLVDCGWPRSLPAFTVELKRKGISPTEIKYLLATHFHPDHAGLVQEFKDLGASLILMESQTGNIGKPEAGTAPLDLSFIRVSPERNIVIRFAESRQFLKKLGIDGEVMPTPGHSNDSITLVLDEGVAFTGDLPPRFMISEDDKITQASWDRIYVHNIKRICPAHGT